MVLPFQVRMIIFSELSVQGTIHRLLASDEQEEYSSELPGLR
jgi:hypothetical protein